MKRSSIALFVVLVALAACRGRHQPTGAGPPALGPLLHPNALPRLPAQGVAVEVGGAVVLVGLDGVPLGHLPGLSLDPSTRAPGPVVLEGEGRHFVVTTGRPSISSSGHRDIPLVAGASLVGRTGTNGRVSWTVERSGSTVWGPMRAVSISSGRDLVTAQVWRMTRGRARAVSSSVFDVRTDRVVRLAADCVAGARLGRDLLLLCSGTARCRWRSSPARAGPDSVR